ncbi:MAG: leucyl aminopeptidase, partial [Alphaproteobacteria bacterium]|nr:leucyl aminopeptidase [Alphaproteobacteria bacterium]
MRISISPARRADADTIAFAVGKGALTGLPITASKTVIEGAKAARFTGETAAIFETFVDEGGKTIRVMLVGIGAGNGADFEKAGAALVAKLLTSGAAALNVEFPGGANGDYVARLAFGLQLRGWRMDAYRTRLSDKQKPTLQDVTLVSDASGAREAWERLSAVADGVLFARELVAEPANILYPESFVER